MSSTTVSVKRHNHRVHPCASERKEELLKFLITRNAGLSILVVTANDPVPIQNMVSDEHIIVMSDAALTDAPELQCDLLISYDLPEKAIAYMARLSRTKTHALILLDPKEQKQLYPIETLLGRNIMQETISGYEPDSAVKAAKERKNYKDKNPKHEYKPRQNSNRPDRKHDDKRERDDKRSPQKPYSSDSKEANKSGKYSKKKRQPSKYIGKDENGKPIFSGKTHERNHRYDGTPRENTDNKANRKGSGEKQKFSGNVQNRTDKPHAFGAKKREDSRDKKPWEKSKPEGSKKPQKSFESEKKSSKPASFKRPPRVFKKSLKQQKESE